MTTNRRQLLTGGMVCLAGLAATARQTARAAEPVRHRPRPNSRFNGVQIGVQSYSFRDLPDQTPAGILGYCLELGINAVELQGSGLGYPIEQFDGVQLHFDGERLSKVQRRSEPGQPPLSAAEQREHDEVMAAYAAYKRRLADLRAKASMRHFERMRRRFNDAGVSIYAFKPNTFEADNTDAEVDYGMRAAKTLGANQVNVEMPTDPAQIARLAAAATRHGLHVGYHAHLQATPTLWDAALAESPANCMNLDLGWYVAAGAADPLGVIRRYHARIDSMHLKDRQNLAHGQRDLPWGQGDTPLSAALRLMRDQHYAFPAAIELEYDIPAGSDVIKEIGKCLDYCRRALAG
jgi:sugar phosphate isomerase/epimerase